MRALVATDALEGYGAFRPALAAALRDACGKDGWDIGMVPTEKFETTFSWALGKNATHCDHIAGMPGPHAQAVYVEYTFPDGNPLLPHESWRTDTESSERAQELYSTMERSRVPETFARSIIAAAL